MTTKNLPALPSVTRVRPTFACTCGCGLPTQRSFRPGHDARLKGLILRVNAGVMTLDDIRTWAGERGEQTVKAVQKAMADASLMKRWGIAIAKAEVEKSA